MKIQDRLKPDTIVKNEYEGYQGHSPRFIVGYWSIRGLGAPIRMLLSAAQINHWVAMYDVKEKNKADGINQRGSTTRNGSEKNFRSSICHFWWTVPQDKHCLKLMLYWPI